MTTPPLRSPAEIITDIHKVQRVIEVLESDMELTVAATLNVIAEARLILTKADQILARQ